MQTFVKNERFRPFGALGAISAGAACGGLVELEEDESIVQASLASMAQLLGERRNSASTGKPASASSSFRPAYSATSLVHTSNTADVLVSYHPEAIKNVNIVAKGLSSHGLNFLSEDATLQVNNLAKNVDTNI